MERDFEVMAHSISPSVRYRVGVEVLGSRQLQVAQNPDGCAGTIVLLLAQSPVTLFQPRLSG